MKQTADFEFAVSFASCKLLLFCRRQSTEFMKVKV